MPQRIIDGARMGRGGVEAGPRQHCRRSMRFACEAGCDMALIIVDRLESPGRIEAKPGDQIEVTLPEIASTGYRWKALGVDPGVLAEESSSLVISSNGIGAGGVRHTLYRAVGLGKCTIHFILARSWETEQSRDDFDLEVSVSDAGPTG
jgi:predicted secreted protein